MATNAVKVGVGGVNAVSGKRWDAKLQSRPQDYLVVPNQPWLDGINAGAGFIRQFVAMPLGRGYTVEAQVTGREEEGGIQLVVVEPKPGRFPDQPPRGRPFRGLGYDSMMICESAGPGLEMGLAAGGRMRQQIYPDAYGTDTWDAKRRASVCVHIVNSEMYRAITGEPAPSSPISARTYTQYGLPWFDLYDEHLGDVEAPGELAAVQSIGALDMEKYGAAQQDDEPVAIAPWQVKVPIWPAG
jgi:hypothetical protein